MTLIIAGFDCGLEKRLCDPSLLEGLGCTDAEIEKHREKYENEIPEKIVHGIYFASDSAITDGDGKTLLNGFRKVLKINVNLWKPFFNGETFLDYSEIYSSHEVCVAFAGSTLSAQHYINVIENHLGNLRLTYKSLPQRDGQKLEYKVILDCEENPLKSGNVEFADDTFLDKHFSGLLTSEYISNVVHNSIKVGVASAKKYAVSDADFKRLNTDIILAVQCPKTQRYHLYKFDIVRPKKDGVFQYEVRKTELNIDEVAVIGLKEKYSEKAQKELDKNMSSCLDIPEKMYDFLNQAITEAELCGNKGIAFPSVLKVYRNWEVLMKNFKNER